MGLLRSPSGQIVDIPDEQVAHARSGGYEPIGAEEAAQTTAAPEAPDTGVIGGVNALSTGALSGLTLGGSDYLLKSALDKGQWEQLKASREQHPITSAVGQVAGAVAPALIGAPEGLLARSPAGLLSEATGRIAGEGFGATTAAAGIEGATQNAGAYISDTALGDRDLTAESLAGALGSGFAFGAGGGVAAHGIAKGTMAARRMFARVAEGGEQAASDAAMAWDRTSSEVVTANDQAADIARARLERMRADVARKQAAATFAEEQAVGPAQEAAGLRADINRDFVEKFNAAQAAQAATADRGGLDALNAMTAAPAAGRGADNALLEQAAAAEAAGAGGIAPPSPAEIEKLTALVEEHDAARTELEQLLQRIEEPQVQRIPTTVPVGEFGAPGARGIKQGAELVPRPPTVVEAPTGEVTAVGKRRVPADGTPVAAQAAAPETPPTRFSARGYSGARLGEDFTSAGRAARELGGEVTAPTPTPSAPEPSGVEMTIDHVNDYLQTGRAAPGGPHAHELHAVISDLDSVSQSVTLPKKQSAFMPLDDSFVDGLKRGAQVAEPGYSALFDMYTSFHGAAERPNTLLQLEIPKGAKVGARDGGEFLLPRGSRYRVTAIENGSVPANWNDGAGPDAPAFHRVRIVRAKLLPHEGAPPLPEMEASRAASGVPDYATIKAHEAKADTYLEQTVPAREIAGRGYYEPPGGHGDATRAANARKAIAEGQREAIKLNVSPEGKITVTDGRHRLAAAIEADAPIRVKWSTGFEPAADDVARAGASKATAPAADDLLAQLQGTAAKLGEGHTLGRISAESPARAEYVATKAAKRAADAEHFRARATGTVEVDASPPSVAERTAAGHPLAAAQLEQRLEAATARAESAVTDAERAGAEHEVAVIEEQLSRVGARPGPVEDIAAVAPVITRYEKASAALTEALGDEAPAQAQQAAKLFRDAEAAADRKALERTTRAVEDHADGLSDWRLEDAGGTAPADADAAFMAGRYAPRQPTQAERVKLARADKMTAGAAAARAAAREAESRLGAAEAAAARPAAPSAAPGGTSRVPAPRRGTGSFGQRAVDAAAVAETAIELADSTGLTGLPHPRDIPVIGGLLSAYLKYRALKATIGRFVGRVPATGDARAAALAARVKDQIAIAVDRSLGLVEAGATKGRPVLVAATTRALHGRLVDDGEPDARKDAPLPELAAVRIRELAAAVTRPELVTQQVRRELRDVTDPDLIAAAEKHRMATIQYLDGVAPKMPPPSPFAQQTWQPSEAAAMKFARQYEAAFNPGAVFDALVAQQLTTEGADALQATSPKLFNLAQQRFFARAGDTEKPIEYAARLRASVLFKQAIDRSMDPAVASRLQAAHAPMPGASAQPPSGAPPVPSVANGTNLTAMYQPAADRRAMR